MKMSQTHLLFKIFLKLFLAVLDLHCYACFSLVRAGATPSLQHAGFSLQWLFLLWGAGPSTQRAAEVVAPGL